MKTQYFSFKLVELMEYSEIKNISLANALKYDTSYVSKWVNGKVLPAEKNYQLIIDQIVSCLMDNLSKEKLNELMQRKHTKEPKEIALSWKSELQDAYVQDLSMRGETKQDIYINYRALIPTREMLLDIKPRYSNSKELTVLVDFMDLQVGDKLQIIGINEGRMVDDEILGAYDGDVTIGLALDPSAQEENTTRFVDIMHLICAYSKKRQFSLYLTEEAKGKMVVLDRYKGWYSTGMLEKETGNCISYINGSEKENVQSIEGELSRILESKPKALHSMKKSELTGDRFLKIFSAPEISWLIGHLTELCLEMEDLNSWNECRLENESEKEEIRRALNFLGNSIECSKVRVLIYESALADFIMNGEFDLFNRKVTLSPEKRKKCIENLMKMHQNSNIEMGIIRGNFRDEYRHAPNPCLFSSSLGTCLRMENGKYRDNVFQVVHNHLNEFFLSCFDGMWQFGSNTVVKDFEMVHSILNSYRIRCEIFAKS